ncbi:hypothetical protein MUP38_04665 [Candidatus Bathyarchaeota archaeon]|nr:hypothetical protein [Candidatus Bathyarchaeota archaeon]
MILIVAAIAAIGFFLWLLLRLLVRKFLRAETARLKARIRKLGLEPEPKQTTLANFLHDRFPYERRWIVPEDPYKEAYPELTSEESALQETQEIEEDEED